MNEAQWKVLVRVSFTVSTLCLLLAGLAIACSRRRDTHAPRWATHTLMRA